VIGLEEQLKALIKEAVKEALQEMNINQPKEILSVKELCKWLGVSAAWVSTNKDKLHIPYFKMGGDKFYRKDIEQWIEENKENVKFEKNVIRRVNIKPAKSKSRIY
jgi:predicted DNA-binding transcriptional regulator AlpA